LAAANPVCIGAGGQALQCTICYKPGHWRQWQANYAWAEAFYLAMQQLVAHRLHHSTHPEKPGADKFCAGDIDSGCQRPRITRKQKQHFTNINQTKKHKTT
jgi:hypothetical protein